MFFELLKDFNGQKAGTVVALTPNDAGPLVRGGVVRAVADDPLAPVLARSLETLINQTLHKIADAQAQSRRVAVPALLGDGLGAGSGDPKKSFGDWCLAVARNDRNYLEKHYGSQFNQWSQKAAMGESSGVTGGYAVPPEFYQQLMTIMAEQTFIRPRAFVQPMGSATLQIPYLDITTV